MQEIQKPNKNILPLVLAHIVVWILFLSLPVIFRPRPTDMPFSAAMLLDDILSPPRWPNALLLIAVFYFNYYFAIPKLYIHRRYAEMIGSIIVCFGLFFFVNYLVRSHHHDMHRSFDDMHGPMGHFEPLINSFNLFMFLIVYAASFAICLYEQWQKTKEQMLNTEISFLKAQINPHFLFNTLNSIYSLTLTKSDNAPDAVVKLSGMMRYSISEAHHDYVSLAKEIEYISNYIDLQRLRVTNSIRIDYEVTGGGDGKQIAPFLLIPFVENAFKHGVNSEQDSHISIKILIQDGGLVLSVVNKKVIMRKDKDTGTGLGIGTTKKRLDLLYPGKYKFEIQDDDDFFRVSLQITLR